jgi:hypothetical protein
MTDDIDEWRGADDDYELAGIQGEGAPRTIVDAGRAIRAVADHGGCDAGGAGGCRVRPIRQHRHL